MSIPALHTKMRPKETKSLVHVGTRFCLPLCSMYLRVVSCNEKEAPVRSLGAPRLMGKHSPVPGTTEWGRQRCSLLGAPTSVEPGLGEGSRGRLPGGGRGQEQGKVG